MKNRFFEINLTNTNKTDDENYKARIICLLFPFAQCIYCILLIQKWTEFRACTIGQIFEHHRYYHASWLDIRYRRGFEGRNIVVITKTRPTAHGHILERSRLLTLFICINGGPRYTALDSFSQSLEQKVQNNNAYNTIQWFKIFRFKHLCMFIAHTYIISTSGWFILQ